MARLSAGGASEKDAMLKKESAAGSEKKTGTESKSRQNPSSGDGKKKKRSGSSSGESDTDKQAKQRKSGETAKPSADAAPSKDHSKESSRQGSQTEPTLREQLNKKYIGAKIKAFFKFLYHSGLICNRTVNAWICTIFYLLCIYTFLGVILVGSIFTMIYFNKDAPIYYGTTTFIGGVPGIGFEPRKRHLKREQNVLKWNTRDPRSYAFYVRRIRKVMYGYAKRELMHNKYKIDCKKTIVPHVDGKPVKHFCKTESTNSDDGYGYGGCALSTKVFLLNN